MTNPIKVLIIDDSAFIRAVLSDILGRTPGVQVVGTAPDPIIAMEKIKKLDPDVLTLDVEMPKMDGLTFLRRLMAEDPRPVVMISSWTAKNSEIALKALELGAIDYVAKPTVGLKEGMAALEREIATKVIHAARTRHKIHTLVNTAWPREYREQTAVTKSLVTETSDKIIAIGASTGGTVAVTEILRRLPADLPGVVIVQHMPEFFTASFAKTLDGQSRLRVKEAADGDRIMTGQALVAPGGRHLKVERQGAMYYARVVLAEPVNLHRPSVDFTFFSLAESAGQNTMGIILTGMGEDGARGLKALREAGAYTIAQDEKTSVVYGMPKKAAELGAAVKICPINDIPEEIQLWAKRQRKGVSP